MSIKSLTITEDAYDALKTLKHSDESFSDVILRISKEKRDHVKKYFGILKDSSFTTEQWMASVKKGRSLQKLDLFIASICLAHGTTLITTDADFENVDGLLVRNVKRMH